MPADRRECLRLLVGSLAVMPAVMVQPCLGEGAAADREPTQKEWLDEVFSSGKAVKGGLYLYRFSDEMYALTQPISWAPNANSPKDLQRVDVPKGFITDFASVPRIFWSVLPRDGTYLYPAIVHDYMYWNQSTSRDQADETLREGMQDFSVDPISLNAVYWGVRAGGWVAWNKNAKLKAEGARRTLSKMPEDPLIKLSDWEKDPSHFQ
ncbi:hypothetical protein V1280_005322 [Bradyrhizobium sp. AZCC 2230]